MTPGIDFTDCFIAIDMDRTLIDTNAFADRLPELFRLSESETREYLDRERTERGKEFDAYEYLAGRGVYSRTPETRDFIGLFSSRQEMARLLLPGASDLLSTLKDARLPHGIWTKGSDRYQQLKVDVLRQLVDAPGLPVAIISDDVGLARSKAHVVEKDWYDTSRARFLVPASLHDRAEPLWVQTVVVIDDKPENLTHSGSVDLVTIVAAGDSLSNLAHTIRNSIKQY